MAILKNLRKGADSMRKAAETGGGKRGPFIPTLRWKDDQEKHYVLFLQSMDETPNVLFHKMMNCGTGENGKTLWRDFISRRDDAIDGSSGYDGLADLGYTPSKRGITMVCEMEPVHVDGKIESFTPMTRTFERKTDSGKEEVTEAAISLVIESPSTFFKPLTSYASEVGPIEDQVFLIQRMGKDQNTTYSPIAMVKPHVAPENVEDAVQRLEDHVEELADEERMRSLVDGAPTGHVFNKYAKMKGGKAEATAAAVSSGNSEPSEAPAPSAKAEPKPKKRSRFEELQAELTGKQ